jgi:hypothetical protein
MYNATWIVLIVVALLGIYVIRTMWRKLQAMVVRELTRTPSEIHLTRNTEPKWEDEERVLQAIGALRSEGFEEAGAFGIDEIPAVSLFGLVHPVENLFAVVYEHALSGVWTDVCLGYANGNGLTVTNAPEGQEMDHMPGQEKIYMTEADESRLVRRVLTERGPGPYVPATAEEFAPVFEGQYAREMAWREGRGFVTLEEVRRMADKMDLELPESELRQAHESVQHKHEEDIAVIERRRRRAEDGQFEDDGER